MNGARGLGFFDSRLGLFVLATAVTIPLSVRVYPSLVTNIAYRANKQTVFIVLGLAALTIAGFIIVNVIDLIARYREGNTNLSIVKITLLISISLCVFPVTLGTLGGVLMIFGKTKYSITMKGADGKSQLRNDVVFSVEKGTNDIKTGKDSAAGDSETKQVKNAVIVLLTSHYLIYFLDNKIATIPIESVVEIKSPSSAAIQ